MCKRLVPAGRARHALRLLASGCVVLLPLSVGGDLGPVLHEYVPQDPHQLGGIVGAGGEGQNPAAIRIGEELLNEPPGRETEGPNEKAYRADDEISALRRHAAFRPDDETHLDSLLHYFEAFSPAIAPFKRLSAMDAVRPDFTLGVADSSLVEVSVLGSAAARADHDVFWGSVIADLEPSAAIPIPSVAPNARILSYRATPAMRIRFFRDSADNFYVRGERRQSVRIVFLTDAPASYFGAELPGDRTPAQIPGGAARPLPRVVSASAQRVARALGLSRDDSVGQILSRLASHFRSFKESDVPPSGFENIYENLALGGKGVCRHRAFAFMVTANGLGIPTRFVMNEAHAFVESLLPDTGWLRIDLGGAAEGLSMASQSAGPHHRPRHADELPQPAAYRDQYTMAHAQGTASATAPASAGTAAPGARPAPGGASQRVVQPAGFPPGQASPRGLTDTTTLGRRGAEPLAETATFVDSADRTPRRGGSLRVKGRVLSEGRPMSGAHVQVFLSQDGRTMLRWLGTLAASSDGQWAGEVALPTDIEEGAYHVIAVNPGDSRHAPSMSRP